jgi:hypothetical protein
MYSRGLRPFGDFRKSGMRKLFEKILPGFVPWHRFTVAKKLKNFYKSYKAELIEFFKIHNIYFAYNRCMEKKKT